MLGVAVPTRAELLFSDNFEANTEANYQLQVGYYTGTSTNDYHIDWAFDYSAQPFNFFRSATDSDALTVPAAPSGGGTKGLKLTVNKNDDEAGRFAINLYPKGKNFSGNYVMKFDAFFNHASYFDTGAGTTEYLHFGINHKGDRVNWGVLSGAAMATAFATDAVGGKNSDGLWFAFAPDAGAARDFWAWEGVEGAGSKFIAASGAIPDRNGDGAPDLNDADGYNASHFPSPPFEGPGAPSKRWVRVEVSQLDDVITWKLDGHIISRFTNNSAWKSGTIMLGYSDPFAGVAAVKDENWSLIDNLRVERIRKVVVDTAENTVNPGDGKTSLLEALTNLDDNDIITFNIPGDGPHIIVTPLGGYPIITKSGVVIDGYSQPGASVNTAALANGNNAKLKIVLDSRGDDSSGSAELPNRRSTRLPFPGYGDSENGILALKSADNVTIKGLCFLSRQTSGEDTDPSIYSIALVEHSQNVRVQGCWFGVNPDGVTQTGGAAAVAAFRHRVAGPDGNIDTYSEGLVYGTDSDSFNDLAEGNVAADTHLILALELPQARVAGNLFNVLPDGKTFSDVQKIYDAQIAAGRSAGDSTVENFENGRLTTSTVIGTDGDGVNDAGERNVFNHVAYTHLIEFYSNNTNAVIAGNYFGVGADGTTLAPVPTLKTYDLIGPNNNGYLRLGSNGDGISDALEGNVIAGITGVQLVAAGKDLDLVIRGNAIRSGAFGDFPFTEGGARTFEAYLADVLVDPTKPRPTITSFNNGKLTGTIPKAPASDPPLATEWPWPFVDVYLLNKAAAAEGRNFPAKLVASFLEGSTNDLAAADGDFQFDLSALNVPAGESIAVAVTYSKDKTSTDAGRAITGPISAGVSTGTVISEPLGLTTIARSGNQVTIAWTGGKAPFTVQYKAALTDAQWTDLVTTSDHSASLSATEPSRFLRIRSSP